MASERIAPVGLVVEGKSEYYAVPVLARTMEVRSTVPANFEGQSGKMKPDVLAERMLKCVRAQLAKGIRKLLVVLDRESRDSCPPDFAREVMSALMRKLKPFKEERVCPVAVIVADRKFENWLLTDPQGLASHALIRDDTGRRRPVNVDGSDGEAELRKLVAPGKSYSKGEMTGELAKCIRVELDEVGNRSRSLRKFLKELQ